MHTPSHTHPPWAPWRGAISLLLGAVLLVSLPGCRGCLGIDPVAERERKKKEAEEAAEKKKKKPKPDFEVANLQLTTADEQVLQNLVKPGHWTSASQVMRANNFDFPADLESSTVDRGGEPIELEHAPYGLRMSRPASLPKGQAKSFEMFFYIPRRVGATSQAPWFETKLRSRRGGREAYGTLKPASVMPSFQYFMVVLAQDPDRYGYLKRLPSIIPPTDSIDQDTLQYYRVVLPQIEKLAPVPSHALTWTAIAHVVWDDLDVSVLSPDQQQAILDWLHWGGQLVISGPNSLGRLPRSFLSDYLPAKEVRAVDLPESAFDEMNEHFALPVEINGERVPLAPPEGKTVVGVELELEPGGQWVPKTGSLVAERRVGRGRIVVTAFPLSDRSVVNWPSFDNFFNAVLLRRPPRVYGQGETQLLTLHWQEYRDLSRDPRLVTGLRYFSRDIDHPAGKAANDNIQKEREIERQRQSGMGAGAVGLGGMMGYSDGYQQPTYVTGRHPDNDDMHFGGFLGRAQSGVAGWTDFSGAAHLARGSLQQAAGIDVPESDFVLKVMGIYLLVLAPLNWVFFRLIGRVEWAWIAAPIIAVVGAVAVVRMAQLDIGFARSRTEVAILETQGDYHRGHLTRYTALYTSLSSNYMLAFEEPSALATPFAVDPNYTRLRHQSVETVYFDRVRGTVQLRGFPVQSNSTNMVHSEQMYPLGDGIKLAGEGSILKVYNGSELPLRDVGVFRRNEDGEVEGAWLGDLDPKTAKTLSFRAMGSEPARFDQWEQSPATASVTPEGEVSLSSLVDLAIERLRLRRGDVRLVAWTDAECGGLEITPGASQQVLRTLVLSHLRHGEAPPPRSDENLKQVILAQGARDPLTDADIESDVERPSVLEP
ncbi:MAG: hypothetical protein KY475_20435 [Planctomycetes bacterium]|nr:hypothetical protein [Planctomycetota bacterium]